MLACLRAALISSIFGSRNLPDPSSIRREAEAARAAIELAVSNAGRVAGHHSSISEDIVAIDAAKAIGASAIAVFSPDDARLAFWAPLNGIHNEVPYDTVFSFCREDIAQGEGDLRNSPIWNGRSVPSSFAQRTQSWLSHIDSQTDWSFWHRWYKQMTNGTFQEWDLAIEVAKIPDEVWEGEDAVAKVAEAIREIEARRAEHFDRPDSVPELNQKKLLEHVRRLLIAPDMTALAAEGAADTLERAIAQYLKEAPANCLPDALAHLEGVPSLFRRIATTVKSAERADAKEARLATDVEALNAKIARLESDLRDARAKTVHGLFTQSALKAAGTAFGASLGGSLGLTVSHFFGEWPSDLTLENFRGWTSDLGTAEPKPEAATLPPSYEA